MVTSIKDLEFLPDIQLSILGYNYLSQFSITRLLEYYIGEYTPNLNGATGKSATGIFLNYFKSTHSDEFSKLHISKVDHYINICFTDASRSTVKDEIDLKMFDISAIGNILQNCPLFPSCKYKLRRNLKCNGSSHIGKCCGGCDKKHNCSKCGKEKCPNKMCCLTNSSECNHPCKACATSRKKCLKDATVCCKACDLCLQCMGMTLKACDDRMIREPIKFVISLRNLVCHHGEDTWNQLKNGTFKSPDFPDCNNEKDLLGVGRNQVSVLLKYLKKSEIIIKDVYEVRKYELRLFHIKEKAKIINKFWEEILDVFPNRVKYPSFIEVKMDVEVKKEFPTEKLKLYGEFMDYVVNGMNRFFEKKAGGKNVIKLERKKCKINRCISPRFLKIEIKVTGESDAGKEVLRRYAIVEAEETKLFFQEMEKYIKDHLEESAEIETCVQCEEVTSGSLLVYFDIYKTEDVNWSTMEKGSLTESIKQFICSRMSEVVISIIIHENPSAKVSFAFTAESTEPRYNHLLDYDVVSNKAKGVAQEYMKNSMQGKEKLPVALLSPNSQNTSIAKQQVYLSDTKHIDVMKHGDIKKKRSMFLNFISLSSDSSYDSELMDQRGFRNLIIKRSIFCEILMMRVGNLPMQMYQKIPPQITERKD